MDFVTHCYGWVSAQCCFVDRITSFKRLVAEMMKMLFISDYYLIIKYKMFDVFQVLFKPSFEFSRTSKKVRKIESSKNQSLLEKWRDNEKIMGMHF